MDTPDPAQAGNVDEIVDRLRRLKVWAGDPSYEKIKDRVNAARTAAGRPASELTIRSTVANCFQLGRRRLNTELVLAVVGALHPDPGYVARWRQALRTVAGEIEAVSQVRVQDKLPPDLAGFTGRAGELDRLRQARLAGDAVVLSAIEGMAGVGKTQLAIHAGHLLHAAEPFDRVLFVNLRGFHPDPAQPPADPAAVLDGFLRLLGLPGQQIPYGSAERAAAYRSLLAGTRALIVLDNAATVEQVGPLLPAAPGCLTLITSRRRLTGLDGAVRLAVDVFAPAEALTFLAGAVPGVPRGADPEAAARIARRCGYLPLALSLIAGHIRNTPGWTLTDHADRLDERHQQRRLDTGVELALRLSDQHLPAGRQRLLRLAALHPGPDFDAYAAAALTGLDLPAAGAWLDDLHRDHLLERAGPGRYTFHDLVRAYAAARAHDEDRPADRRAALTRLFDHYLATAAAALNTLYPAEQHRRPRIAPAATPAPDLTDPDTAKAWLDAERPTLVAVAGHTATHGWPGHTTRLARTLSHYLGGGHHADALIVHGYALDAARADDDPAGQAYALTDLGLAHIRQSRPGPAVAHLERALALFRRTGDPAGQARVLYNLGVVAEKTLRYPAAIDAYRQALGLYREAGDGTGETYALSGVAVAMERSRRYPEAIDYYEQTLALARRTGNRGGEAQALNGLANVEMQSGRCRSADDHLRLALVLCRQLGHRTGEACVLDTLGMVHTRLGRPGPAAEYHRQALAIFRDIGDRDSTAWALNGLGEAVLAGGRPAEAVAHHSDARAIAAELGAREQHARADAGLGYAHHALGDLEPARLHYAQAVSRYAEMGAPEADEIRARLAAV